MKTCPNCGQIVGDEELFCPSCGTSCENAAPYAAPEGAFCPNCGQQIFDNAVFCPNCGAATNIAADPTVTAAAPAPAKKAPNSRVIGMAAAGVAALAVIVLVFSLVRGAFSSPADRFVAYQRDLLVDQVLDQLTTYADEYNGYLNFSTDMTITADTSDKMLHTILDDSAIALKMDLSKNSLLANGELILMGSPVLGGTLSYDKGTLGVYLPELDSHYYTADLGSLVKQMGGDDDVADALAKLEIPELSTATLTKLGKCYIDVVLGAVNKDNVTVADDKKIRLSQLHKNLDGTSYIFQPTAEDVEEMLLKLADTIEEDKDLRAFVTSFIGNNAQLLQAAGMDMDDLMDEALLDAADYLRDNASYVGRMLERSDFSWTLGVSDKKVCLQRIEMNDGENVIAYESIEGNSIFYVSSYGSIDSQVELEHTKKDGKYSGTMTISDGYSDMMELRFKNVDKGTKSALGCFYGEYTITSYGTELRMTVAKADGGGTDHEISIDDLGYFMGTYLDDLDINIHTTDKKSTASTPKASVVDVSAYTEMEFYELFSDLEYSMSNLADDLSAELYRSLGNW